MGPRAKNARPPFRPRTTTGGRNHRFTRKERRVSRSRAQSGAGIIEILAVLAIIGLYAAIALPQLTAYKRRSAVVAASAGLRSIFREMRSLAIARSRYCAVKFTNSGSTWMYTFYEDGDGDGVMSDDIKAGIDHRLSGPFPLDLQLAPATIAVPPMKVRD